MRIDGFHSPETTSTDGLEDHALATAKKGDTTLTIFLLKARRPAKYRENVKATSEQQAPIELDFIRAPGRTVEAGTAGRTTTPPAPGPAMQQDESSLGAARGCMEAPSRARP